MLANICCACGSGRCDALTSEVSCLTSRLGAKCAWVDGARCMQLADALLQRSNKIVNDVIEPSCPNDCKSSLKIHAYARSTCDKFRRNQIHINCKSCPSSSTPRKQICKRKEVFSYVVQQQFTDVKPADCILHIHVRGFINVCMYIKLNFSA